MFCKYLLWRTISNIIWSKYEVYVVHDFVTIQDYSVLLISLKQNKKVKRDNKYLVCWELFRTVTPNNIHYN